MEINKTILASSIGAAVVVIAGGVYANIRAINKIKKDNDFIKRTQGITDAFQHGTNMMFAHDIDSLKDRVDSLEKSNKNKK